LGDLSLNNRRFVVAVVLRESTPRDAHTKLILMTTHALVKLGF